MLHIIPKDDTVGKCVMNLFVQILYFRQGGKCQDCYIADERRKYRKKTLKKTYDVI